MTILTLPRQHRNPTLIFSSTPNPFPCVYHGLFQPILTPTLQQSNSMLGASDRIHLRNKLFDQVSFKTLPPHHTV